MQQLIDQIQITYDSAGRPKAVTIPYELFSKKRSKNRDLDEILKTSTAIAKKENIKLKDVLAILREVRRELYKERYG